MRWKPIALVVLLTAVVVATAIKNFLNQLGDKGPVSTPCTSSAESKRWRTYVCLAKFEPGVFNYRTHEIVIREAWVERTSKELYFLVWFPYRKNIGGYQLCFTLRSGNEVFTSSSFEPPFFVIGKRGNGFATVNLDELFYDTLDELPPTVRVSLLSDWKEERLTNIVVRIDKTH